MPCSDGARYAAGTLDGTTGVVNRRRALMTARAISPCTGMPAPAPQLAELPDGQYPDRDAGGDQSASTATYPYQPMFGPAMPDVGSVPVSHKFIMQAAVSMRAI